MQRGDDDALTAELATLFTWDPSTAQVLARDHVADGHGRCRCCSAGPQGGRVAWPCRLATLTTAASARTTSRRDTPAQAALRAIIKAAA